MLKQQIVATANGMPLTYLLLHNAGIDIMSYEAAKVVSEDIGAERMDREGEKR